MKLDRQGRVVAVVGASSLLGKEILAVLQERRFPISRLVTIELEEEDPGPPILDLSGDAEKLVPETAVNNAEVDFAFVAARLAAAKRGPEFLRQGSTNDCVVIDLVGGLESGSAAIDGQPSADREGTAPEARRIAVAHPAVIVLRDLLLRVATRHAIKVAVATIFFPASESGPQAIDELQKQTVSLLSFQKIPRAVFGSQLAFNILPRLGGRARAPLVEIEKRITAQLRLSLGERVPTPAVRVLQAPVFYSLAVSLYLETVEPASPDDVGATLAGKGIRVLKPSQQTPTQVEVTGSSDILVDTLARDREHPGGIWIWAVADNLRLAAVNAVTIAERIGKNSK